MRTVAVARAGVGRRNPGENPHGPRTSADKKGGSFRAPGWPVMKTVLRLLLPLVALAAGFGAMSLAGGCGSNAPPGAATVRGRVTLNGQPVAGGLVVFTPDAQRGGAGKPARAETGPDGGFALRLDASQHIPAGWYRVALAPAPVVPDPLAATRGPVFPAKLARPDLSGLEREVQPGKEHVFEFAVEVPVN